MLIENKALRETMLLLKTNDLYYVIENKTSSQSEFSTASETGFQRTRFVKSNLEIRPLKVSSDGSRVKGKRAIEAGFLRLRIPELNAEYFVAKVSKERHKKCRRIGLTGSRARRFLFCHVEVREISLALRWTVIVPDIIFYETISYPILSAEGGRNRMRHPVVNRKG